MYANVFMNIYILQMTALISNIDKIHSNLSEEIDNLRMRVEKCEIQVDDNSSRLEICEKLGNSNCQEIKHLDKKVTAELSRCSVKVEEKIPYVFSAPIRNRYFAGRTWEIQELKRILKVEETLSKKKIRVAGVCGLGGVGKTTLVSEYAHEMKEFYKGGVYWFSAEDDTFLEKTVENIAARIDALDAGSFDSTLSNFFKKISTTHDPSLIVLDCLDELNLSCQTLKFLHSASHENVFGHFLVLTRRDPNRLVNEVSVFEEDSFVQLKCFKSEEAKQFLFSRTGVDRDVNVENIAESLCDELGALPLALEQAGAYIKMLRCSLASYLKQYRTERLRLLSQQPAPSVSPGNESSQRLAVHTTWKINLDYIKMSPYGPPAVRFMNACSFFNGNEIEEQLLNVGKPALEDIVYRECVLSPLGPRQVLKPLTDFSLFTYVDQAQSVSTHRLVQDLLRENLDPESKVNAFGDAVRILNHAFSKSPSPTSVINLNESEKEKLNAPCFYMWSKLCMHGDHVCRYIEDLLTHLDSVYLVALATILYECAVHLSAYHKQEEAKRTLNFGYRVLDWIPLTECKAVNKSISNKSLFRHPIPLPKSLQIIVKRHCAPPFALLQPLTFKPPTQVIGQDLQQKIKELTLSGQKSFDKGLYPEALDAFSSAIDLGQDCSNAFNPLLLTNRSKTFLKMKQYENALQDANDYITRRPACWRGYAFQALALNGLNDEVSAEISAALAFYHNRTIFFDFLPFECFLRLQKRIFICDSVEKLEEAIFSPVEAGKLRILVLGSSEYILNFGKPDVPWNNCVLVGTRRNRSISLKSNHCIFLLKCMLTNLSFLTDKCPVRGIPGSFVKILNCNFSSFDTVAAFVTEGELNAEHCNFTNCIGAGLGCLGAGNSVVVDCSFSSNGRSGVEVLDGGALNMKSSRMFDNRGYGLLISSALKCVAANCDFNQNDRSGIHASSTKNVTLECNNVYDNQDDGIYILHSQVDLKKNNSYDNGSWGIFSLSNSRVHISTNYVFRNKDGGVRVGYSAEEETFIPSVVELNRIYDNVGPGLIEEGNVLKVNGANSAIREYGGQSSSNPSNIFDYDSLRKVENEVHNNKEIDDKVGPLNFCIPYCSNCRTKCKLKRCMNCLSSAYCNKACQTKHWPRHKEICKVLREKSSCMVTLMERAGDGLTEDVDGVKGVGAQFNQNSIQKGVAFVVKVYSGIQWEDSRPLVLYDRSRVFHHLIYSEVVTELVKEFGLLCKRQFREKKLFFYCVLDNGKLRLFTNEFPEFQSW